MFIRELTISEFTNYAKENQYSNFRQTLEYALLKSENGYEYEIIGYCDKSNNIYAAALVLVKIIDGYLYAYIPAGFLTDFDNPGIVHEFTDALYNYYKKEDIVFIKINPLIPIAEINPKTHAKKYNENYKVIGLLENCGFTKLDDSLNLESMLPQTNAIVDLDEFDIEKLSKNTKNKIRKAIRKGLTLELGNTNNIHLLNEFVQKKTNKSDFYYNDYYNIFKKSSYIDYFLISVDYDKYIINSRDAYEHEILNNNKLNDKLQKKPGLKNVNTKMNSDKALISYKNDIAIATHRMNANQKEYIAGALVVRYGNMATVVISGYNKKYGTFSPNYFLYYAICNYYKNEVKYLDLNGISADFSKDNKYHGLNDFKLGFKPSVYEYVGEFDLIINKRVYNRLLNKGSLEKEFSKK